MLDTCTRATILVLALSMPLYACRQALVRCNQVLVALLHVLLAAHTAVDTGDCKTSLLVDRRCSPYLNVNLLGVRPQWDVPQHCSCALGCQLPRHHVRMVLCNRDQDLRQATGLS